MARKNWDWFQVQRQDTEKDLIVKLLVINGLGSLSIVLICVLLFVIIKLVCIN